MVMLNELKPGKIARIVAFENKLGLKNQFVSNGIIEGSIIRIISTFGLITFNINSKIISVSKNIAENIRIIELKEALEVKKNE